MKRSIFVCAAVATVLLGFASASWAAGISITGGATETWSTDKTLDTTDSWFAIGSRSNGTLNQTGGLVTANTSWGMAIGEIDCVGIYNMSGNAGLITTGGNVTSVRMGPGDKTTATWNMTGNSTAAIGLLNFSQMGTGCGGSTLNLSGSAAISATDVAFDKDANSPNWISFASGSLATLTVSNKVLADYQTLVTDGFIRVNGVVQSNFNAFQVSGHTLSLAVPEPGTMTLLICGLMGLVAYAWRKRK